MAVVITPADVTAFYATSATDAVIQMIIDVVDGADTCLDTAPAFTAAQQKLAKIYGVCFMLVEQDGGEVDSESSFTGDSVTYKALSGSGAGFAANRFGKLLTGVQGGACVSDVIGPTRKYPAETKNV